ncbi:helix-turn-helix domain-containing protein [Providencia hangzhouensis]|uniref:helix-turn-helix domain-containing protein n=1 Tax=Providencia hangzhouensis TaxID=3031799 RepID=UPI00397B1D91
MFQIISFHLIVVPFLKKKRKELGISGLELAKRLNISQQQVSRYERGVNKMSLDMLLNISIALNVPMDKFNFEYYV